MPNDYDSDPWIRTPKYARFGGENVMIGQTKTVCSVILNTGKTLPKVSKILKQSNVFNINEQTVLV